MTFVPTKSGIFKIGLLKDADRGLMARLNEELMAYRMCPLTPERVDAMIADIASVVIDIAEEQDVDPPNWIICVDHSDSDVQISFKDEDGTRRSAIELEAEIHRRAVCDMLSS